MLRRFSLGFTGLIAAASLLAACSSSSVTKPVNVGPNFASQTLYATNATQNGISIYPAGTKSGGGPQFQIGGSNTNLAGPQYLTFDSNGNLFTTTWTPATGPAAIVGFRALATGNVIPILLYAFTSTQPRGIANFQTTFSGATTKSDALVVAVTNATQPLQYVSQLQFFVGATLGSPYQTIAGPQSGLSSPIGVAVDSRNNVYVANNQASSLNATGSVEVFALPSPSPTPTATATVSPSPSPTASATASATPVATATPLPIAPIATLAGNNTGINSPTGIALDTNGNIYVADPASSVCGGVSTRCAAILIFAAGSSGNATPTRYIGAPPGPNNLTLLISPTDVKVDNKGNIYVADSTPSKSFAIYTFAPGATGNVAPTTTYTSPGAAIGLALSP